MGVHQLRRIVMMASRIASRSAQAATRRVLSASVPRQTVMPASMMTSTPTRFYSDKPTPVAKPYTNWADSTIAKISGILIFATLLGRSVAKETVQAEKEAFELKQKTQ